MILGDYIKGGDTQRRADLCKAIDCFTSDISLWISEPTNRHHRSIPEAKCVLIELHTKGESTCEENRPDLNWARIPDPNWPHPAGRPVLDLARQANDDSTPLSAFASA